MRVCFSVGQKSPQIINTISKSADNVEFFTYGSISEMIKESITRHLFFDRIVLSEKLIGSEKELKELSNYISNYSDNTSIVLICQASGGVNEKVFNELFKSPLYTVVLTKSVTTVVLLEFVKEDILSLKTKYYVLDKKETKAITGRYAAEPVVQSTPQVIEKPEKRGFLSSLFGGKGKSSKKQEIKTATKEPLESQGNSDNLVSQNSNENGMESISQDTPQGVNPVGSTQQSENRTDDNLNTFNSASGLGGVNNLSTSNFSSDFETGNLGLGDLGEQHIDTGFLDEDSEYEIESELQAFEEEEDTGSDFYEEEGDEAFLSTENISNTEVSESVWKDFNNVKVLIGESNTGVTSYIVNYALSLSEKGNKVLIVDLDYKKNGILSYVDADKFYENGNAKGITNIKVYSEEGVDIISNGYGYGLKEVILDRLVSSGLFNNYDTVLVDCPLDCIDCLSSSIINISDITIKVEGNRGSLVSLLSVLTGRTVISPSKEDALFRGSVFHVCNKIEAYKEDLNYIENLCFFGRYDWSSKF